MEHEQGTFKGAGGMALFYQFWRPVKAPEAMLALVHGAGDHSGRFERLVGPLMEHGLAVGAFDLRGFGRSPGRRGHINRWAEYREDVRAFLAHTKNLFPGTPLFLMGYSLGAAIALDYALRSPEGLRGAIFSGTPIEPAGVATQAQIAMARLFSRAWPTFAIQMTNDIHGVSRDEAVLRALEQDPWHHSWVTARWGTESLAATEWIRQHAGDVRLPVLFIHGGDDPFNLVRGTQRYFEQISYADKTLKVYAGSRHETHNDLEHQQVAEDIIMWILNHC